MTTPRRHLSMPRILITFLIALLAAKVAAQGHVSPPLGPSTNCPMVRPGEEHCTEGYGLFRCADPINCTAITGEISCRESSPEAVVSKLSKGRCGFRSKEADRTCLTSIVCAPLSTHYTVIFPLSKLSLLSATFTGPPATTAVNSTIGETRTQTQTQSATAGLSIRVGMDAPTTMKHPITFTTVPSAAFATAFGVVSPRSSTTEGPSLSFAETQDHKPMEGSAIGGTVVGVIAGGSLLVLVLYLLFRRWKTRKDNCNPKYRGLLAGPRVPTGSTVPASAYRPDGSDGWHTPLRSERNHQTSDLEANHEGRDIGLQYYSDSANSPADGPTSPSKERSSTIVDDHVTPSGWPARQSQDHTSPPWSADNESSTLHSRRSNTTIDWPLPKSTVSSPALLMNVQSRTKKPPAISPLSPLSPFGDYDTVRAEVEEQAEKEQHRQDAYKKLSGEVSDALLTKKPGSVSRARQNITAAREAQKKPGSVARARQNIAAARGAIEQPRAETSTHQNMTGLQDFIRGLDAQCSDEEVNETGTVVRRKNKRAH